jgi:hypothetical protein
VRGGDEVFGQFSESAGACLWIFLSFFVLVAWRASSIRFFVRVLYERARLGVGILNDAFYRKANDE